MERHGASRLAMTGETQAPAPLQGSKNKKGRTAARAFARCLKLMTSADAKIDGFNHRGFDRRIGEQGQRIAGHRAVMAGALNRIFDRAMLAHQPDREFEVRIRCIALLEHTFPKARSSSLPRRKDSTTGSVILPSRKSSPTFLPSFADVPP